MNCLKKIIIATSLSFALLIAVFAGILNLNDATRNQVQTVSDNRVITINPRSFASSSTVLMAPYKTMDIFLSETKTADFSFTSVGGSWEEVAPAGTRVEAQVKFKINGTWTDWIDLEEEQDRVIEGRKYAMASTNAATAFQYKYLMYGDGNKVPLIKNSEWTFIKAGQDLPTYVAPTLQPQIAASTDLSALKSLALSTSDPTVISRSAWGADESYRYEKDNNTPVQLVHIDPDFYNKYANELQYSRVVEADENGNKYKWPLQYPEKVEKVIIHHTATSGNLDNPKQAIRDIYYYHAVTRGWGDIGYNYLVDQQGNIYEGRYGGEGVIGAHAGPGNHGSIGIAFLGDYEANDVPEAALVNASKFIYEKAKIHGIDISGSSEFRGKIMPNLFAHRDIMSTDCPGQFLYAKIPLLRTLASVNLDLKPKFVKDYDYQDNSSVYYVELKPFETQEITMKLQNIGNKAWDSKTILRMEDSSEFDGVIELPGRQGFDLAKMEESSVPSGGTATFKFSIKGDTKAKTVYLHLVPYMSGKNTVTDRIILPISVEQPVYKYEMLNAKFPPALIKSGDKFDGTITLKNDGNVAWQNSGDNVITLKGNSFGITAKLKESNVASGETGTFNFSFTAPAKSGSYKEIFTAVMANAAWVSQTPVSFETVIYEHDYDSELLGKTALKEWIQGETYDLSTNLQNVGSKPWNANDLQATFARTSDVKISNLILSPATIAPGAIGTISFKVNVSKDAIPGNNVLLFAPKIVSNRISQTPFYFYYQITQKELQSSLNSSSAGKTMRVKLSFTGDPQITANGSFNVYSGTNLISTLSSGELTSISYSNGSYIVQAGNVNFVKSDPIRLIPDSNSILKIKNYDHQPSWSTTLNDNEYRGILEVRYDNGNLIVINELPIEDYLKGLGEVSNSELPEKIKAVIIAARTYAEYYLTIDRKFPGEPYDLDDNPEVSQLYLGYSLERRSPNVAAAVELTKGQVVTYQGKVVKTPFFNQSDGTMTKSAQSVWGWRDTPYLVSVDDSYCDGKSFLGHGVGLSGCGAKGMAALGKTYDEILKHYYTGVDITTLY